MIGMKCHLVQIRPVQSHARPLLPSSSTSLLYLPYSSSSSRKRNRESEWMLIGGLQHLQQFWRAQGWIWVLETALPILSGASHSASQHHGRIIRATVQGREGFFTIQWFLVFHVVPVFLFQKQREKDKQLRRCPPLSLLPWAKLQSTSVCWHH